MLLLKVVLNNCVFSFQESGFQDIGINLTQFHSFIDQRVTCSNRAQRAETSQQSSSMCFYTGMNSTVNFD